MTRVEDFGEGLKITLDRIWWPLMELPDYIPGYCALCTRAHPLNKHHVVPRSAGEVIDIRRRKMRKPLIQLCGIGNHLRDADGNYYCHGKVENHLVHFRNMNGWYGVIDLTDPYTMRLNGLDRPEPVDYLTALDMKGWRPL